MKCPHCNMDIDGSGAKCEWCGGDLTFMSEEVESPQQESSTQPTGEDHESPFVEGFVLEGEAEPGVEETRPPTPDGMPAEGLALGIDLGTTNSVGAVYIDGRPECVTVEGNYLVPSVVSFKDARTMLVGMQAKRRAEIDPENTIRSIKRKMGDADYTTNIYGNRLNPPQVSSFILKKIKDATEKYVGAEIKKAVITVPAYFTSNQKEDTRRAGEMAGLEVLRLLPEPTAAAIAYGLDKERDQTILVYDLGGGTFDVSILEVKGMQFSVKAISGNHDLGGDDFDRLVTEYLIGQFKQQEGVDLKGGKEKGIKVEQKRRAYQLLNEASEKVKKDLSESEIGYVDIPDLIPGHHLSVELTRDQFNDMIRPLVVGTRDQIRDAFKLAAMTKQDIDRVVLVGGSTIIPIVREFVTSEVRDPYIADNVLQIVAQGACILASSLAGAGVPEGPVESGDAGRGQRWRAAPPIELNEVSAHSLGVELLDFDTQKTYFHCLIERNTQLPAEQSIPTTTVRSNQTEVLYPVYQGESRDCKDNNFLAEMRIKDIPARPAGVPQIKVTFRLDQEDILRGSAVHEETGQRGQDLKIDLKKTSQPRR